jgi:hypothetical protein
MPFSYPLPSEKLRSPLSPLHEIKTSYSQSFPLLPTHSRCRSCLFSLDHTQTRTIVGRTPLDGGLARRRDLYLTIYNNVQDTKIHAPGGIRTHDPSKRSAADLFFLDFLTLEDGTDTSSRNVDKGLPLDAALHPRRAQIS